MTDSGAGTGTGTATLADLFALEQLDDTTWLGRNDGVRLPQLFGGQLVAQSLVAAGRDVAADRLPHSVHTTFLRAGLPGPPVRFEVERLRDGGVISTRVVSAVQEDRVLCRSTVSAVAARDGVGHSRPRPVTSSPLDSPDLQEVAAPDGGLGEYWDDFRSIEVRVAPVDHEAEPEHSAAPVRNIWMRSADRLPDDPLVHQAALAYASDLMLMSMAVAPHGMTTGFERSLADQWHAVSLDHTMWFHRDVRADEWMVFEHSSPSANAGRALIEAAVFAETGEQACHVAQEALIRRA